MSQWSIIQYVSITHRHGALSAIYLGYKPWLAARIGEYHLNPLSLQRMLQCLIANYGSRNAQLHMFSQAAWCGKCVLLFIMIHEWGLCGCADLFTASYIYIVGNVSNVKRSLRLQEPIRDVLYVNHAPYDLQVKGQGHYRSPGVATIVSDVILIQYRFEYRLFSNPRP